MAKFGYTPGFANNNRCSHGNHCTLSPAEIKAHSLAVQTIVDRCDRLHKAEQNFSANRDSGSVWVRGGADQLSQWTVTVGVSTYRGAL
jgi:hypothetical protein